MATKLYLEASGTVGSSSAPFDSGWTDTSNAVRYPTHTTKASTTLATKSVTGAGNAQADLLIGQWISRPLIGGQTVTGGQTVQVVILASETSNNNNLFVSWGLWVFNNATQKKILIAKRNDATEVVLTTLTSRTDSASSTAGNYTTVQGDRLIIEIGLEGDPTGGNTHDGSIRIGSSSGSDLAYSDGVTTDNNPSVQLGTDTLTFEPESNFPSVNDTVTITEGVTTLIPTLKPAIIVDTVTITEDTSPGFTPFPPANTINNYMFVKVGNGMSTSEKIK